LLHEQHVQEHRVGIALYSGNGTVTSDIAATTTMVDEKEINISLNPVHRSSDFKW